ncbi:hypothetical protein [Streptomyces sp. NPDC006333]|uniref:DUF6907 domain-containing protein n=1 Tax=Streptomyces sp. NPDC006333 TaxID=3156753 RepID=UPI0033AE3882
MANHALAQHAAALAGTALPAIQSGHRLVPARIGRPGHQADVFVECPTWCAQDHVEDWNQHAVDLDHWAKSTSWDTDCINQPGDRVLSLDARLHSDPGATDSRLRAAHVLVDDESVEAYLTPEMAERTADELIAFAAQLRHLAREAREFNAQASRPRRSQADEALRRVRAGRWQSLSIEDIESLPIARLLKAFAVSVVETDGDGTELLGEPGAMEFRVGREVGQQLRDREARRLLAAFVAGAREGGVA